jgi:hypothetical protein
MTETPPTKPPLPPLRERLKLPDRFIDVTGQHKGEVFVPHRLRHTRRLGAWCLDQEGRTPWSSPSSVFSTQEARPSEGRLIATGCHQPVIPAARDNTQRAPYLALWRTHLAVV